MDLKNQGIFQKLKIMQMMIMNMMMNLYHFKLNMIYDDDTLPDQMTGISYEDNKMGNDFQPILDTYRIPVDADNINYLYFKNRYSKIGKETIF